MNIIELVKNYLTVSGIPQDEIDENTSKIFYTVSLKTMADMPPDEEQLKVFEESADLFRSGKKQEGFEMIKTAFANSNAEAWQFSFLEKLLEYLMDMADKMGASLSEEQKQKLAGLISNVGA